MKNLFKNMFFVLTAFVLIIAVGCAVDENGSGNNSSGTITLTGTSDGISSSAASISSETSSDGVVASSEASSSESLSSASSVSSEAASSSVSSGASSSNPFGGETEVTDPKLTVKIYNYGVANYPISNAGTSNIWGTTNFAFSKNIFADQYLASTLYTKDINVTARKFNSGFPGASTLTEYFAVDYTGDINVTTAGEYTFIVVCDDGAKIAIDGTELTLNRIGSTDPYWEAADNFAYEASAIDSTIRELFRNKSIIKKGRNEAYGVKSFTQHCPLPYSVTVNLTAGKHAFNLKYFQGPQYHLTCVVKVVIPGSTSSVLFNTELFK